MQSRLKCMKEWEHSNWTWHRPKEAQTRETVTLKGPNQTLNQMLFNPTKFQKMSELLQINFKFSKVRIRWYQSTFQTMSEPFQIIFKSQKVGIRYIHSLYMLNNVWMTLNIISIGTTLNQMLFNLTDTRNNVQTIPNNFKILKCLNWGQ